MKTLIIYDSFYGNTQKIAETLAEALACETVKVQNMAAEQLHEVELLVLGSPTRAFRPSPGIAQYLSRIPTGALTGVRAAAFDTRSLMDDTIPGFLRLMMKWFGWAAPKIAKQLARAGATLALAPDGFCVRGSEGPLVDGELERAVEWARGILSTS